MRDFMTNSVGGIVSMQKKRESCRGQKKGQNVKQTETGFLHMDNCTNERRR